MACYVESLKHRKSLSSLLKQIAAASFDKLKDEIKAALTDGSKMALDVDAWTGVNIQSILESSLIGSCSGSSRTAFLLSYDTIWVQREKQMGEDGFMNLGFMNLVWQN